MQADHGAHATKAVSLALISAGPRLLVMKIGEGPDQPGYLMTVLEPSTANLDNRAGIVEPKTPLSLRRCGLYPTPRGLGREGFQWGRENLIDADNLPNCFLLSDDALAQIHFEL